MIIQKLRSLDHLEHFCLPIGFKKLDNDFYYFTNIVITCEVHFWLKDYVNKQNCRFWNKHNSDDILENPFLVRKDIKR